MSVTEKLDKFMREHGFNKADVARLSGVPYTTIDGLYKKGDENTKLSTLRKLAACTKTIRFSNTCSCPEKSSKLSGRNAFSISISCGE